MCVVERRLLFCIQAQSFWIKGRNFSVSALLGGDELASLFEGGSIAVFRLAPQDYHRYHFPTNGVLTETRLIDGPLYTVNPIAVNKVKFEQKYQAQFFTEFLQ